MRAVTALQPSPASFLSWAFTSPMFWENEPVSLIQLSSRFEQAAASLAFWGAFFLLLLGEIVTAFIRRVLDRSVFHIG